MPVGPITRARAKRYQINVNAFCQTWVNSFNNFDDSILDLFGKDVCILECVGIEETSGKALEEETAKARRKENKEKEHEAHLDHDGNATSDAGSILACAAVARSPANRGRTAKEAGARQQTPRPRVRTAVKSRATRSHPTVPR